MMRILKIWAAALLTGTLLAACGGGSAGSSPFGPGAGTGTGGTGNGTGTTPGPTVSYVVSVAVQRSGAATTTIASTETVQAVARVATSAGQPVAGVVVTFSENAASLLKFAPVSATALTDASGNATLDIAAKTTTDTGATEVHAAAMLGGTSYVGMAAIQIQAGAIGNTRPVPAAMNFVSVLPQSKAIVIKGAGGSGRSESATLSFQIVDASNTPIKGAPVNFTASPPDLVTLNIPSATSDANGMVTTTVQSGTRPGPVTVIATSAEVPAVSVRSDALLVSNGPVLPSGFEIVADKYNLDTYKTGDAAQITAFVRDPSGNPVPDGLAVSFTTDYGVVASATQGGCTTANGQCTVEYRVQDPRPPQGIAIVTAKVREGQPDASVDAIPINVAGTGGLIVSDAAGPVTRFTLSSCKQLVDGLSVADGLGHTPAAGTLVELNYASPEVTVSVTAGSPVPDDTSFAPAGLAVQVDLTSTKLSPPCISGGSVKLGGFVSLKMTTPAAKRVFTQRIELYYPQF